MNNKKQIIIIHGGEAWDTHEEYIKYLNDYDFTKEKLNKILSRRWKDNLQEILGDDFQVIKPQMPSKSNAKYNEWAIWFEKLFPYLNKNIILIGHSLGANFLAKYLSENIMKSTIDQIHLVAGCYGWKGGFELADSLVQIEKQSADIFLYQSMDDPLVDFTDAEKYQVALPSATFVKFDDRGHFLQEEFPEIIENVKD